MQWTAAGGWVVTNSRLLLFDGTAWRGCWGQTTSEVTAPWPDASVDGQDVRVARGTTLWLSLDGCVTWTQATLPIEPESMAFPTSDVGYVAADGASSGGAMTVARIYRTVDRGLHWTAVAGRVTGPVDSLGNVFAGGLSLAFADAERGFLTDGRTLWRTADGGASWRVVSLPKPASVHDALDLVQTPVVAVDGSAAVVVKYDRHPGMDGAAGQEVFYRTTDFGAHWAAAAILADPGMLMVSLVDPGAWVVYDEQAGTSFRATDDAGRTWRTTAVTGGWPLRPDALSRMSFGSGGRGWFAVFEPQPPCPGWTNLAGQQVRPECDRMAPPEHLLATDDGGATWREAFP